MGGGCSPLLLHSSFVSSLGALLGDRGLQVPRRCGDEVCRALAGGLVFASLSGSSPSPCQACGPGPLRVLPATWSGVSWAILIPLTRETRKVACPRLPCPSEGRKQGFPREGRKCLMSPCWVRLFRGSLFKSFDVHNKFEKKPPVPHFTDRETEDHRVGAPA